MLRSFNFNPHSLSFNHGFSRIIRNCNSKTSFFAFAHVMSKRFLASSLLLTIDQVVKVEFLVILSRVKPLLVFIRIHILSHTLTQLAHLLIYHSYMEATTSNCEN